MCEISNKILIIPISIIFEINTKLKKNSWIVSGIRTKRTFQTVLNIISFETSKNIELKIAGR